MRIPIVGTRHSKDNYSFEDLTNKIMVGRSAEGVEPLVVVLDSDTANEALNKLWTIHGTGPTRHDDSTVGGARSGTVLYVTVIGEVPHDQTLADAFNVGGASKTWTPPIRSKNTELQELWIWKQKYVHKVSVFLKEFLKGGMCSHTINDII